MKHQITIEGMTCGGCASRIATTIQADAAVTNAVIDFATRTGVVEGDLDRKRVEELVTKAGYKVASREDEATDFKSSTRKGYSAEVKRLMAAGILAAPVVLLAMGPWHVNHSDLFQAILTTVFLVGPAQGFLLRAFGQLRHGYLTMDTLVSLGMLSGWAASITLMTQGHPHLYFESAVMIGFFVLLGKTLEDEARRASIGEVDRLVRLRPRKAWLKQSDEAAPVEVPLDTILVGQTVYVRPGDMLALDGVVSEGSATFDESVVSGESIPQIHAAGHAVPSGAVNVGASGVSVRVTRIGKDTVIEQMIQMIEDARMNRPPVQALADKISGVFVPVVIAIAILTFGGWMYFQKVAVDVALMHALAVLVVACPCALGLATPVAWVAGLGRAARSGILVRSYEALEKLSEATTIVFDKTGTLTLGKPEVTDVFWAQQSNQKEIAAKLLSALSLTSHPVARAVAQWIRKTFPNIEMPTSKLVNEQAGDGVVCELKSPTATQQVKFGRVDFVVDESLVPVNWLPLKTSEKLVMACSLDGKPVLALELEDRIRDDAAAEIARLRNKNIELVIASGDKQAVVSALAQRISGFSQALGRLKPEGKRDLIQSLKNKGQVVAFVGDGINDAPALAVADVGLAMSSGTDVAAHAAGLVIQRAGISSIAEAMELSKRITKIIRQNFFWAFFYNVAAIPLAVIGFMTPMWAAAAMAMSSVSVVVNSLRLRI